MNSILIPNWMMFYDNPDIIKNAMLVADEITLVVPMTGIDKEELFIVSFNSPPEDNPATAIDKVLSLANQNIIKIENGLKDILPNENNSQKLYGHPWQLQSPKLIELIHHFYNVSELAKEKEAIILNDYSNYHNKKGTTEKRKLIKAEILKNCSVQVPDFTRLDFEEIAKLKTSYQDEFINAQIYINSLSYSLIHDIKGESASEQIKYVEGYVKDILNPRLTVLLKTLNKSKQAKIKSIIRKIAKLIPLTFTPTTLLDAFGEVFKTGIDITGDIGKKEFGTEQGAFLNIMVKSYKQ